MYISVLSPKNFFDRFIMAPSFIFREQKMQLVWLAGKHVKHAVL